MSTPFVIICCLMLTISTVRSQDACADLDTGACALMHASQPGLCGTALGDSACIAYCGKCSTLPPPTTTVMLKTTRAPCEDIDTLACQKMHQNKPDLCQDDSLAELACKRFCGRCPVECYSCPTLVRSLSECVSTTTCQVSEACYVMEVFDFDASHGFRAGCLPKDLCIPHNNEQMVGRSSSTVHTSCCDTDRCNIPATTTTTTTSTTRTTTHRTPHPHCSDKISNCNTGFSCAVHPNDCAKTCRLSVECYSCPTLVRSLSECVATTTCQLSEACYVMEVFDFDTSHGFRAGCMPKDLCIPHSNELVIGRSSSTVHTSCCDTDRCNIPSTTTTTTSTTTTTRLTPHSNCSDDINVNCNALFACVAHRLKCARTCGHCH